ncbi:MAG: type II toxin-antitoxin system VapC family toxin [Armatimonadota bacterium]|nr:type II toxin-antitoxin system VapC family toxin [Armatimonadota bacterium]
MSDASTADIYILDANLLLRLAEVDHIMHPTAQNAVTSLTASGMLLHTVPQSLFEFWAVATRPETVRGLGFTLEEARASLDQFVLTFPPLADALDLFVRWRRLIEVYGVGGKQGHDARYIAAMQAHGLTHILSFDADFNRYAPEGITVVDPAGVLALPSSRPG